MKWRICLLCAAVLVTPLSASEDPKIDEDEPKAAVCHRPPGNPSRARTLCISESSVAEHLEHGDTQGACPSGDSDRDRAAEEACAAKGRR
jgi:hypothetical protein